MTPEQLKALIEGDATALRLFKEPDDFNCALRCTMIAPPARRPITAQEVMRSAMLDFSYPAIVLAARESSPAPPAIKGACIAFLAWMDHDWPLDVDLPEVQQMLGGMIQAGLVKQEQAAALSLLANTPQIITAYDVEQVRSLG